MKTTEANGKTKTNGHKPNRAVRTFRWIARETSGRELVVYQPTESAARALLDESKLFGERPFTIRQAGHIDVNGRLYADDEVTVDDRRITS